MRTIIVANQKGGVGKSTTAINLVAGLARKNKKALLIDSDPQGHSTLGLNISTENHPTLAELLTDDSVTANQVIQHTYIPGLDIIPCDLSLAMADIKMATMEGKEFKLRNKINSLHDTYDFAVIDCSPTFGTMTINAFTTGDSIILPIKLGYLSLEGVSNFLDTVNFVNRDINKMINHKIGISGTLITFYDIRTKIARAVVASLNEVFGDKVFHTKIPQNVKINEAQSYGKSIFDFDPKCKGAMAYESLVEEVLTRESERK
ncbi:MAG: ParA family protein [Chlamydiales bacterium]